VKLPMRRTILMALLAALFLAPAAYAGGTRVEILRDCQDDGVLQGDYSASQMRDARSNIPAELDEYSDCRDVLTRAISDKTAPSNDGSGTTNNSGGTGTGGTGSGTGSSGGNSGGTGGDGTSAPSATPTPDGDSGREVPATPQEWNAIKQAQTQGPNLAKDLKQVSPGESRLTASVGRNGIPGMLVAVLALIAAAAIALVAAPLIRRRGLGPRT
jgi:hypothetical protein